MYDIKLKWKERKTSNYIGTKYKRERKKNKKEKKKR